MVNVKFTKMPKTPDTHRINNCFGFSGFDEDKEESFFCLIDDDGQYGMVFYANGDYIGVDFDRYSTIEDYCSEANMTLSQTFASADSFDIDILVKE